MLRRVPVKAIAVALAAVAACGSAHDASASPCAMKSEILETRSGGPLVFEVFGAGTLCIETQGGANLAPFTPTVRIRNTSADAVTLRYQLDPARSFRSKAIWPAGQSGQSVDFRAVSGGAPALEKTLAAGEDLLISSWTRHNDEIRRRTLPDGGTPAATAPHDFVVRFDLAITYDSGDGPVPVAESFDIALRAVPATQ